MACLTPFANASEIIDNPNAEDAMNSWNVGYTNGGFAPNADTLYERSGERDFQFICIGDGTLSTSYMNQSVNMDYVNNLGFWYKRSLPANTNFTVSIDGTPIFVYSASSSVTDSTYQYIEIDTSAYTGNSLLEFTLNAPISAPLAAHIWLDDITIFDGGDGTATNKFNISNVGQIQSIHYYGTSDFHYIFTQNISCEDTFYWNGAEGFIPIGTEANPISIDLDMNGFSLGNDSDYLYIYNTTLDNAAIFAYTGDDFNIYDGSVYVNSKGHDNTSAIVAVGSGTFSNIYADGQTLAYGTTSAGWIAVSTGYAKFYNCTNNIWVANAGDNSAGFVALGKASFDGCVNLGHITADHKAGAFFSDTDSTIDTRASIYNCYNVGNVIAYGGYVGGLAYNAVELDITNSHNAGYTATNNEALRAGLVYSQTDSTETQSYWDIERANTSTSALGTGLSSNEMAIQSNFVNWDFNNIWIITDSYPILQYIDVDPYDSNPYIIYPENATVINSSYPATTSVEFEWTNNGKADHSTYQIARDSNYNTLVSSGTTTNFYKTLSLDADDYYFRVKYEFDDGSESDYTEVQFSINATVTDYGQAMQGVVYTLSDGSKQVLSGAKVTAFYENATQASITYATGENGFYLFEDVAIGSWNLIVSKDGYETSVYNNVVVTSGNTSTLDILLEEENAPNYITPHYVQFIVKSWNKYYPDAIVTIYVGDSATPLATLTTDTTGSCGYELSETTRYRITVYLENVIDTTVYITPTDDEYTFYVDFDDIISDILNPTADKQESIAVSVDVAKYIIDDSSAIISVTYNDIMDETSDLNITIAQNVAGDIENMTVVDYSYLGTLNYTTANFTISDYGGESYYIIVEATHATHGSIYRLYGVQFENNDTLFGFAAEVVGWLAIIFVVMILLAASPANVPETCIGACCLALIFKVFIGWGYYISYPGLILALFICVVAAMSKGKETN